MSYTIIKNVKFKDGKVLISAEDNNVSPKTWDYYHVDGLSEDFKEKGKEYVMATLFTDAILHDLRFYPVSRLDVFLTFLMDKLSSLYKKYSKKETKYWKLFDERVESNSLLNTMERLIDVYKERGEEPSQEALNILKKEKQKLLKIEEEGKKILQEIAEIEKHIKKNIFQNYKEYEKEFNKLYREEKTCVVKLGEGRYLFEYRRDYSGFSKVYSVATKENALKIKNPLIAKNILSYCWAVDASQRGVELI